MAMFAIILSFFVIFNNHEINNFINLKDETSN